MAAKEVSTFKLNVRLFTIDEASGGWTQALATHFNDGGTFDRIFTPK